MVRRMGGLKLGVIATITMTWAKPLSDTKGRLLFVTGTHGEATDKQLDAHSDDVLGNGLSMIGVLWSIVIHIICVVILMVEDT